MLSLNVITLSLRLTITKNKHYFIYHMHIVYKYESQNGIKKIRIPGEIVLKTVDVELHSRSENATQCAVLLSSIIKW